MSVQLWLGQTGMSVLLCYTFELDKLAHRSNHHPLDHFYPTSESWPVIVVVLSGGVIPDLAICALTIPTKVAIGNRFQREKLETAKQPVLLRHFHSPAQNFNSDEPFIRVEQLVINCGRLDWFAGLLAHVRKYRGSFSEMTPRSSR